MAAEGAAPWQEIIVPAAPVDPWPWVFGGLALLVLLALLSGLFRWWWQRPGRMARRRLGQIRHQLHDGTLTPREALHSASACLAGVTLAESDRQRLALRFAPRVPPAAELEAWLQGLERGLSA